MNVLEIIDEVKSNIRFAFEDVENLPKAMFKREILKILRDMNIQTELIRKTKNITTTSDDPNEVAFSDLTTDDSFEFYKLIKIEYEGVKLNGINEEVYYAYKYDSSLSNLNYFYRMSKEDQKFYIHNISEDKTLKFYFVAMPTMGSLSDTLTIDDQNGMFINCLIDGVTYRMLRRSDKLNIENQTFLYNLNMQLKEYKQDYYEGIIKIKKFHTGSDYETSRVLLYQWGV